MPGATKKGAPNHGRSLGPYHGAYKNSAWPTPPSGGDRPALPLVLVGVEAQGGSFEGSRTDFRSRQIVLFGRKSATFRLFFSYERLVNRFPAPRPGAPILAKRRGGCNNRSRIPLLESAIPRQGHGSLTGLRGKPSSRLGMPAGPAAGIGGPASTEDAELDKAAPALSPACRRHGRQ